MLLDGHARDVSKAMKLFCMHLSSVRALLTYGITFWLGKKGSFPLSGDCYERGRMVVGFELSDTFLSKQAIIDSFKFH